MDIEEKITKIEVNIENLTTLTQQHHERYKEWNEKLMDMSEKHNDSIYGKNISNPGSNTRIDRLEQSEKKRAWHLRPFLPRSDALNAHIPN